ncbi:MAG: thymidylate synthase [Ruminococcus sp.]
MTQADLYMIKNIDETLQWGYRDVNPRPRYQDGTPAHTISLNHRIRKYDLSKGDFPITGLRPIAWKSAIKEIFWIYQDASNSLEVLNEKYGVHYWNQWESKDIPGTIGIRYGETVRRHDLMNKLLKDIQENPYGRRHIMNLWQEDDFKASDGLLPCCYETIWNVRGEYLDMLLNQRSGDMLAASGAGGINEVQYAALLMMVARHCGYQPGVFTHVIENEQIYDRHIEAAKEMQKRISTVGWKKVSMTLNPGKTNFYSFTICDFELKGYQPVKPQLTLELGI